MSTLTPSLDQFHFMYENYKLIIFSRPGTMLQFQFINLDIASNGVECGQDYLILRNGASSVSPFFLVNPSQGDQQNGHLCGTQMPQTTNTSSNALRVTFNSDSSGSGQGFKMKFSELSNG